MKSIVKGKLKAISQEERIQLWKQHFENFLGNPPKVTHERELLINNWTSNLDSLQKNSIQY